MSHHPFGWDYPAGAENDPNAPYNHSEPEPCPRHDEFMEGCHECLRINSGDEEPDEQESEL